MITIRLNSDARQVAPGTSLAQLVASTGKAPAAVATAVNGQFVARAQREACILHEGDVVTTFEPITGG